MNAILLTGGASCSLTAYVPETPRTSGRPRGAAGAPYCIAQARAALAALMMERQRLVRAAERAIADVAHARDKARSEHA